MFNLQQKRDFLESVCDKTFAVLHSAENGISRLLRIRLKCRSWLCSSCSKKRAKGFANAAYLFFKNDRCRMFTVTVDRQDSLRKAYETFSKRWNHFRTLLSREIGKFKYLRVLECQPNSGYPHYHVIIDHFVDQARLSDILQQAGFGAHAYISEIPGKDAFFYVLKYLKKGWPHEESLKIITEMRIRRCSGSVGFKCVGSGSGTFRLLCISKDFEFTSLLFNRLYQSAINSGFNLQACDSSDGYDAMSLHPPHSIDPFLLEIELDALTSQYKNDVAAADWAPNLFLRN